MILAAREQMRQTLRPARNDILLSQRYHPVSQWSANFSGSVVLHRDEDFLHVECDV